ncbi:hypothetical protein [Taklimakanibacter albus]|uniref:Uncharacterized protein n=1 Tax=Taklimakanibacter albus TaxID=2800327 RepID=A0ACC5R1B1_9HYPH|nr:hypothetical protein [Aestuariivirga sp. YIM B02566]MBK1866387.1 hypothetical protein [Aestuariivirga sp. YIM B02566]
MKSTLLQRLRDFGLFTGSTKIARAEDQPALYSDSEMSLLKQRKTEAITQAREAAKSHGRQLHPKIAAARKAGSNV